MKQEVPPTTDDPLSEDSAEYTLIVKADTDQEAFDALDANLDIPIRGRSVRAIPLKPMRLLTVELDPEEGEWSEDPMTSHSPIEGRLNEWMLRERAEHPEGVGFPMGSLLWWRRGGR